VIIESKIMPAEPFDALLRFGEEYNFKEVTPAKHAEFLKLDGVVPISQFERGCQARRPKKQNRGLRAAR
jgi:hypothetical protein